MTMVTAGRLVADAQEFLRFKRAMGIAYRRAEFDLDSFVDFVARHWGNHGEVGTRGRDQPLVCSHSRSQGRHFG